MMEAAGASLMSKKKVFVQVPSNDTSVERLVYMQLFVLKSSSGAMTASAEMRVIRNI